MVSEEKILGIFFYYRILVSMATNNKMDNSHMWLNEDYSRNISIKKCQNICNDVASNVIFPFSPLLVAIATKLNS